ncbi:MAG: hypothetical protein RBU37_27315 [Myxococcota bacterium]|jgi:hypothetical protein|nr:hypothetical protein [Myxococcota bacterium]
MAKAFRSLALSVAPSHSKTGNSTAQENGKLLGFAEAEAYAPEQRDPWLRKLVAADLQSPKLYRRAAAMGTVHRLGEASPIQAQRQLDALLRGEVDPTEEPARRWIFGRAPSAIDELEREACQRAEALAQELFSILELPRTMGGSEPAEVMRSQNAARLSSARLHAALHRRDELEGLRVLLEMRGRSALTRQLAALDAQATSQRSAFPVCAEATEDERLLRACACNPEGWWTSFGSDTEH